MNSARYEPMNWELFTEDVALIENDLGRKQKKILIIFVGPQAVGKTTQAKLLMVKLKSQGHGKVYITRLITYALFHHGFQNMLRTLSKSRKVLRKFYEDESPQESVDPQLYRKLFLITEGLHLLGFVISVLKQKMLMARNNILIEYEGYVFKQLADLWFLAKELKIAHQKSVAQRLLSKITRFLLFSVLKDSNLTFIFQADYDSIRTRCLTRKSHIEPEKYIKFQSSLYNKIYDIISKYTPDNIKAVNLNADRAINEVHSNILSYVMQYMSQFN